MARTRTPRPSRPARPKSKVLDRRRQILEALAFSPDGSTLAAGTRQGRVWLFPTQPKKGRLHPTAWFDVYARIWSLSFLDERRLVVVRGKDELEVTSWDVTTQTRLALALPRTEALVPYAVAPRSGMIGSSYNGKFQLSTATKQNVFRSKSITRELTALRFSPDESKLAAVDCDLATVHLLDVKTKKLRARKLAVEEPAGEAALSPDLARVVLYYMDATARVFETATGALLFELPEKAGGGLAIDGSEMLLARGGDRTDIYSLESGKKVSSFLTEKVKGSNYMGPIVWSPDGGMLVSSLGFMPRAGLRVRLVDDLDPAGHAALGRTPKKKSKK